MNNTILKLSIKNDSRVIPELASFISELAKKLGLSNNKAYYLCFVIETVLELRTKAIEENKEIDIEVIDSGSYFKFCVTDFGSPYILTKNQQAILKRKLVDKYSFTQNGRKGQSFSFVYYYDAPIKDEITVIEQEELLDEDFTFRKVKNDDEDILEAVKCLYASYGYEYYHQNLYSVDSFKKYIRSGRYIPIIAENKHSQKMCYCALDENEWFKGVPELSNLVTKPIARNKGLAFKIFKETENIAKKENYEGVHVSAVAYHSYTQKMCNKLNYTPSSIEYSINPAGTGGYDADRRLDCVIGVKIFNKTKKHDLYIAQECNDAIKYVFDKEGLNYEIHNDNQVVDNKTSDLSYVIDTDTSNCFVKLDECSNNIKSELAELIDKDEIKNVDVVTINLNMNDINSIQGYRALRELGFIFVGCLPGCINGDYMLLQSFKVKPEYEKIVLEDNYKELQELLNKVNV